MNNNELFKNLVQDLTREQVKELSDYCYTKHNEMLIKETEEYAINCQKVWDEKYSHLRKTTNGTWEDFANGNITLRQYNIELEIEDLRNQIDVMYKKYEEENES